MAFLIAVDGGGTSCRALVAAEDGTPLGEGLAGSANIVSDMELARGNILAAVRLAAEQAGLAEEDVHQGAAVMGLAGANIAGYPERLAARLPFRASRIETDARIALEGALGAIDGAVAVLGTGSVFMARRAGRIRSVGGWGLVVGDFCSGGRLGRTLLEETLLAHDGLREASALTRAVLARYGDDPSALVNFAQGASPRDFGDFAPMIFAHADRGDAVACAIVADAVRRLEDTIAALAGAGSLPFCLLGGLAANYSARLSSAMRHRERGPQGNALSGALAMAVAMFGKAKGGMAVHG